MDILFLLTLFFIKHWLIDFVWQTPEEIANKGTYLKWSGLTHSIKHGFGTAIVLWIAGADIDFALAYGLLDTAIHYHIDWAKIKINARFNWHPEFNKEFWWLLGLDQLLHQLTYVGFIAIMLE